MSITHIYTSQFENLSLVQLEPLLTMALTDPPEYPTGERPVLIYVSVSDNLTDKDFEHCLREELMGEVVRENVFVTNNGWTIFFKQSSDKNEVALFEKSIRENPHYGVVENWFEMSLKSPELIPELLKACATMLAAQTRH